jgi:hypothetical protein
MIRAKVKYFYEKTNGRALEKQNPASARGLKYFFFLFTLSYREIAEPFVRLWWAIFIILASIGVLIETPDSTMFEARNV